MNKHIELVKKWLKDKNSVSIKELQANKKAADAAYYTAAEAAEAADAAAYAAYAAAEAAYAAAEAAAYAAYDAADKAEYWVRQYDKVVK